MSIACRVRPIGGEALLPDGYRRCEYLESTGNQWIDTLLKFNNKSCVKCTYFPTLANTAPFKDVGLVFGSRVTSSSRAFCLYDANVGNVYFNYGSYSVNLGPSEGNRIRTLTVDSNVWRLDYEVTGEKAYTFSEQEFETPGSVYLFEYNLDGKIDGRGFKGRIYTFQVSENGIIQLNFIPCLDDKGKPCMFDTVSRTAFYNQGKGEFLYKLKTPLIRKLPRGFQPLEYLESTGTQYIDTGVKLSNESEVRCSYAVTQESAYAQSLYGAQSSPRFSCYGYVSGAIAFYADTTDTGWVNRAIFNQYRSQIQSGTECRIDGVTYLYKADVGEFITTDNAWLFSAQGGNSYAKIYSFSISRAGVPQLDFQPCLDSTGKPCMWDYVTRKPFYNAATTGPDFLYG